MASRPSPTTFVRNRAALQFTTRIGRATRAKILVMLTRRPPGWSWLKISALVVLAASGLAPAGHARELTSEEQVWLKPAYRHEKAGWHFVHIEGNAHVRGFQHGYLLAHEIEDSLRVTKILWAHNTAMDWSWLLERTTPFLEPQTDGEILAEIDGLVAGLDAAGVKTSRAEMLVYNAWVEISGYWWPVEKAKIQSAGGPPPKRISCSAFIATGSVTADGGIVLGHNTVSNYVDANANIILDLVPEKGHRLLMQTAPGWVHSGTDFFITSAGLVGAETTIGGFELFDEKGIPEFVRMRRAMQDASSIDEWSAIMQRGNNGGYASSWLVGDVNTREIARLELGLKQIGFERTHSGYYTGSNIAEDRRLLLWETSASEDDIRLANIARRVRWHQLIDDHAGKIDLAAAQGFEADHYDPFLEKIHPGGRSLCLHYDLDREFTDDWHGGPFVPTGAFDGKVVDGRMAKQMSFSARWGSACGTAFDADKFLKLHPQFSWQRGILYSRDAQPWVTFTAGEK